MSPLAKMILDAAARHEVVAAVDGVYADLQGEIAARKPVCAMSGRCCRFEEYGHRLYVTTAELAAFVTHHQQTPAVRRRQPWDGTGCPWQLERACEVHAFRPFGCRIFFCDPSAKQWQEETYERYHRRLKLLHEQFSVPYRYVEWRLAEVWSFFVAETAARAAPAAAMPPAQPLP